MSKLIIESTNKNDTQVDIEEKLLKAAKSIQLQREKKTLSEPFLKEQKDNASDIIQQTFQNMISEISEVLIQK